MKTLLLSEVFPPQAGGSGRWFWEVYSRLPLEEVCIAAGTYAGAELFDQGHNVNVIRLPLSMQQWGLRSSSTLWAYWRLFWRLERLVIEESVRTVHAGRVLQEGWLAWMLNRWRGLPYTVYVHGEELYYGVTSRELGWMMRRVFGRAERVIVNSQNTARLMRNGWNVSEEKLMVLHPGVNTKRFCVKGLQAETGGQRSGIGSDATADQSVILTVGRLQKRKGHDMLIRALPRVREEIPDVLYAIVGDGDQQSTLGALAREMGVSDRVQFLGEVGDDEMIRCYQNCDLFALPNREVDGDIEGFGIVLLEAQACGKPVLAGDSGGTAETMIPDETGLIVDCTRPEPLAESVIDLLSDKIRIERMGLAARQWVVKQFDWESLAAKAKRIFDGNDLDNTSASAEFVEVGSVGDSI